MKVRLKSTGEVVEVVSQLAGTVLVKVAGRFEAYSADEVEQIEARDGVTS